MIIHRRFLSASWRAVVFAAALPTVTTAQSAVIIGAVEDSSGRAIPDVRVSVLGHSEQLLTDSIGRFRLGPVRAASYVLQLRRLGFAPLTTVVSVQSRDTVRLALELTAMATSLPTVDVTADAVASKLDRVGFLRRRMDATIPASRFVMREEFASRPPLNMTELLRRMGAYTSRCQSGEVIYVDGVMQAQDAPKDSIPQPRPSKNAPKVKVAGDGFGSGLPPVKQIDLLPPTNIAAIEAYVGPAEIPTEFKAAGRGFECVVLVWTRDH